MSDSPFIGPSYVLASKPASVQRTVNMEPVPLEPGNERMGWVFKDTHGLTTSTTNVAPPSDNLVLLMHMDASPFIDEVGRVVTNNPGVGGTIVADTTAKVFGAASGLFPGGAYLTLPNHVTRSDFGTDPWVVDVWIKDFNAGAHEGAVFSIARDASNLYELMQFTSFAGSTQNTHNVYLSTTGGAYTSILTWNSPLDVPTHLWHHVRFGRVNSTTLAAAYDGVIVDSKTIGASDVFTAGVAGKTYVGFCLAGVLSGGFFPWTGYIEELAMRKVAMNASNFSVPVVPFVYP